MKKTVITALSMCIVFGISSCGSFGKPDPNTISEKNPGDNKVTTKPVDLEPDKAESSQSENSSDDSAESKADTSAADSEKEIEVIPQPYTPEDDMDKFVESVLDKMTLEEKIGQLFIVRPDALELEYENNVINDDEIGGGIGKSIREIRPMAVVHNISHEFFRIKLCNGSVIVRSSLLQNLYLRKNI